MALIVRLERSLEMSSGVPVASAAWTSARGGSPPRVTTTHDRPSEKKPRAALDRASGASDSRYESSVSPRTWTRVGTTPWK